MDVPHTVTAALDDRSVAGKRCLEAGAGAGNATAGLLANGADRVYAVTNDRDHARTTRRRVDDDGDDGDDDGDDGDGDRLAVLEADLRATPLPADSVDVITAHGLCNVLDPAALAAIAEEFSRVAARARSSSSTTTTRCPTVPRSESCSPSKTPRRNWPAAARRSPSTRRRSCGGSSRATAGSSSGSGRCWSRSRGPRATSPHMPTERPPWPRNALVKRATRCRRPPVGSRPRSGRNRSDGCTVSRFVSRSDGLGNSGSVETPCSREKRYAAYRSCMDRENCR